MSRKIDYFLQSHAVSKKWYIIGGTQSPVSIRDQMLRGRLIPQLAFARGIINKDRPLLVAGAGAAGVTAAITSASLGVPTILIEKESKPFLRQAYSDRWICPTQYDWPLLHWYKGRLPWLSWEAIPLPWYAQHSQSLFGEWERIWNQKYSHNYPYLTPHFNTEFRRCAAIPNMMLRITVEDTKSNITTTEDVGMLLSCLGFGKERVSLSDDPDNPDDPDEYRGYEFWEQDTYSAAPDLGLPAKCPKALIVGGGDGAIQDFLRLTTSIESGILIYYKIKKALPSKEADKLEKAIFSIEDQAQRFYAWNSNDSKHDCRCHTYLQEEYLKIINKMRLLTNQKVKELFERIVYSPNEIQVNLAFSCGHFTKCYALNRFFALLVAGFLREKYNYDALRPSLTTVKIEGTSHPCKAGVDCRDEQHTVWFSPSNCTSRPALPYSQPTGGLMRETYDVVIVRRGMKLQNSQRWSKANSRHLLPYHLY